MSEILLVSYSLTNVLDKITYIVALSEEVDCPIENFLILRNF